MERITYTLDSVLDTNEPGLSLIKRWESFEGSWYLCPARKWTIGYGLVENSLEGVNRRTVEGLITKETATVWLRDALRTKYEPAIERLVQAPLSSNEFAALSSFVYNVGGTNFGKSTLLKKLNKRDYAGAAEEFGKWVYADGRVLRGLVNRRAEERALFLQGPLIMPVLVEVPLALVKVRPLPVMKIQPFTRPVVPVELDPSATPEDLKPYLDKDHDNDGA